MIPLRPPYWSWRHDRLKLVITVIWVALALFLALRPRPVTMVAPVIVAPTPGAVLDPAAPGEMRGTAAPGTVIAVYDGEILLGTTTTALDGSWRFVLPPLSAGLHDFSARILDERGRVLARADLPGIRVEAATVAITTPVPATVPPEATPIPPTATPVVAAATPTTPPTALIPASPTAAPEATPTPTATPTSIPATAAATPAPTPAVGVPIVVSGITRPGAVVTVAEGETILGRVTADEQGAWRIELTDLTPGQHELTVTVTDAEGKPVEAPQTLTVVAAPAVTLVTTPTAEATPTTTPTVEATPTTTPTWAALPAILANSCPTLTGTAPPRSHITVYDGAKALGQAIADAHGNWYFVPRRRLSAGEHTLRVEILAPGVAAATVFTATVTVAADARPLPPPTIRLPRRQRLGVGDLLRGTAPPRAEVRLMAAADIVAAFRVGPRGGWAVRLPATLPAGTYTFRLEVLGPQGEVLAVSAARVIEVSNPGPPTTLPRTGGD
jgi:hypothetical protein